MRFVRYLGILLAVVLVVWVGVSLSSYDHWRDPPAVMAVGDAFEGTTQLPREEIERQWDQARERMVAINERGRWFSVAGDVCSWLAFACTAAITLIAGYFGRAPA